MKQNNIFLNKNILALCFLLLVVVLVTYYKKSIVGSQSGVVAIPAVPVDRAIRENIVPDGFTKTSPDIKSGAVHEIIMSKDGFSTTSLAINVGETVIFRNADSKPHWPASNIHPSHKVYPEFDPKKSVPPGASWEFKFDKVGSWRFHDHLDAEKVGTIIVKGKKSTVNSVTPPILTDQEIKTFKPRDTWENTSMFYAATNEKELFYWLKTKSPEEVMRKLLAESSTSDCHQQAHTIGRLSYAIYKAETFRHMETACHSGFMHGGMEAFLQEKGTTDIEKNIEGLCNSFDTAFSRFECLHGTGHGVLAYMDYDLPAAIKICKNLPTAYDQSSCYGGAFMENIMVSIGGGVKASHETRWLSADPHFPCNSVDQDFEVQQSCYLMQTSRMLDLSNQSFEKVATLCRGARADMIPICFQSLGRDAAGRMTRDPFESANVCILWAGDNMHDCIRGALYSITEFWAERIDKNSVEFCAEFDKENSTYCFERYGAYLPIFFPNKEKIPELCNLAKEGYQIEACKIGAGV